MRRLLLSLVILAGMTSATWAWPPSDQAIPRKTLRPKVIAGEPPGAGRAIPRETLRPKMIARPRPAEEEPLGAQQPPATVDQRVKAALASEPQGLDLKRNAAFQAVLQEDSDHAPARWGAGQVRIEGDWLTSDEATERFREADRLAIYRRFRQERWPDTIGGQWEAARWCSKQHLPQQRRAHLNRVLSFDPDNLEARSLLGHQRVGDRWLTADEVARSNLEAREAADAMRKWKPELLRILADLTHRSQVRRKQAAQRLSAIDDPGAVWAMESLLSTQGEATALLMIQTFDGISAPQAAMALTRQTLLSPHESVRKAALETLKKREYETYVPLLLGMLTTPIQSRLAISQGPREGLVYRQELYREGQDTRHLMQISANYTRVAPDVSNYRGIASSLEAAVREADRRDMVRHAAARAQSVATAVTAQNDRIHQSNERICAILSKATGQAVPPVPEQWWQWWYAYNDVFVASFKPVVAEARHDSVIMASSVPRAVYAPMVDNRPESDSSEPSDEHQAWQEIDRGSRLVVARGFSAWQRSRCDCLAAGTKVWTDSGGVAIEQITIGDLVLSQDIQTGELAYKPVLQTTLRPIGPLMEIDVDGRVIQTSGGHPFWVSGAGWTKARDLQPGSRFHAVAATALVGPVSPGAFQVAHNLVVADFHTYFIGEAKILVHDNTIHQPTDVVVPGLAAR